MELGAMRITSEYCILQYRIVLKKVFD